MDVFGSFQRCFGTSADVSSDRRTKQRINAHEGIRVLVVEDSRTIAAGLRRMLQQNRYITLTADDAENGVELARRERPNLIFLDILLPGMNGVEALRMLRHDPLTRDIPVVVMSGNERAAEQFQAHGADAGADDFMKKPFSRADVFERIERMFDADRIPRRLAAIAPGIPHPA